MSSNQPVIAYTAAMCRNTCDNRLLQFGDSELPTGSDGNIQLPEGLFVSTVNELIEFVYVTHHDDAACRLGIDVTRRSTA